MRFLLLLYLSTLTTATIFSLEINEGSRQVIHLQSFGFLGGDKSNCTIIIKQFTYSKKEKDTWTNSIAPEYPVGFSLEARETVNSARMEDSLRYPQGQCFASWNRSRVAVASHTSVWNVIPGSELIEIPLKLPVIDPQVTDLSKHLKPGFQSLFFFNCNDNSRVSFQVEVTEYNIIGDKKSYLSEGKHMLPLIFLLFGLFYSACLVLWCFISGKHRAQMHKIHHLMTLLLFLKALSLLLESFHYYIIDIHGHGALYADLPYYSVLSIKGMLLFFVILLVGTGWSFIKPYLSDNEKKILIVVVPLVLIDSIAIVIEDTLSEGYAAWNTWRDTRRILDVIACCAVLLPVVWSIRNLREATSADGKAARSLVRLRQFRTFYAVLVAYIYFTRIVVPLVRSALHWQVQWVGPVIEELGTLVFYLVSGYKFRPRNDNPYLSLEQEDFDDQSLRAEIEAQEMELGDRNVVAGVLPSVANAALSAQTSGLEPKIRKDPKKESVA